MSRISYSEYYNLDEETRESLYGRGCDLDVSIVSAIDMEWQRIQSELSSAGVDLADVCFELPDGSPMLRSDRENSVEDGAESPMSFFYRLEDHELYLSALYCLPHTFLIDGMNPLLPQVIDALRAESDRIKALADRLSELQKKESL